MVGFIYNLDKILIEADSSLQAKYFGVIAFVFLLSIIIAYLYEYRKNRFMIIFHILYPPFIIYYLYLFSSFIDSKYIIIGLSLIGIELFSLLFNAFLKNFKLIHFCLYSVSFSLIGLIFFSIFWIKSWLPILYLSIFWLMSNAIYIFWNYIINELYRSEFDEFFFSALIFDYNIILAFSFLIKYIFNYIDNYIRERIADNSNEFQNKKYFYLFNFIILITQYAIILTITILGLEYKVNEMLIKSEASLPTKYVPFLVFIFISCIIIMCLYQYKTNKWFIIFHIFYPPFIIYYLYLFSSFIDSKCIIIGLSLVGIELFSLLFNIFLKKFETKHFILFSSSFSLIGLIFFSVFWIKSWLPILYMSIFWLISNAIYICIILAIHKYCGFHEYFYSSLIFDYNLILGIILIIYKPFYFCNERRKRNNYDFEKNIKKFGILLIQYAIITIFVWIGFSFGWNDNIRDDNFLIRLLTCLSSMANVGICLASIINTDLFNDLSENVCDIFYIIFHVPLMIIYIYAFSIIIENKYILSFVFILFLDMLCIFLFVSSCNSNFLAAFISCLFSNIIAIILFHFCWLYNVKALIWLIVLSIITNIYLNIMVYLAQDKFEDKIIFSVFSINYGLFILIVGLFLVLTYWVTKCLKKIGEEINV